jgi:hypothetical protein
MCDIWWTVKGEAWPRERVIGAYNTDASTGPATRALTGLTGLAAGTATLRASICCRLRPSTSTFFLPKPNMSQQGTPALGLRNLCTKGRSSGRNFVRPRHRYEAHDESWIFLKRGSFAVVRRRRVHQ